MPEINNSLENSLVPELNHDNEVTTDLSATNPPSTEGDGEVTPPGAGEVETPEGQVAAPAPQETPAFTPSFKYKVRDEEFDIPEEVRGFITDEKSEKIFQDLYTSGHGLKIAKTERDEYKGKLTDLENSLQYVSNFVQQYRNNPGDANNAYQAAQQFIDALGIPKDMFLQYANVERQYSQLPADQRQAIDAQRQQQYEYQQMQNQNQHLVDQNQQMLVNQRNLEINMALADPSVASIAQAHDSQVGKPGAFRELVVQRGIYHHTLNGSDISPNVAVQEVISLLGTQAPQGAQPGTVNPTQTAQSGTMPVQQQKPVIPNIQGQATASPTKQVVRNLDDIRRLAKQAQAAEG